MTAAEAPMRIAVLEDDRSNQAHLVEEIGGLSGVEVVGGYFSFEEFNEARVGVDLVVLDRWIQPDPDAATAQTRATMTSWDVVAELERRRVKVIVHTMDPDPGPAIMEMRAGAYAVVSKAHRTNDTLFDAIKAAQRGQRTMNAPVAQRVWQNTTVLEALTLTDKQKSVLMLKAAKMTNAQIAAQEGVSIATVEARVTEIYDKIRAYLQATGSSWQPDPSSNRNDPPIRPFEFLLGLDPLRNPLQPGPPEP